MANKGKTVPVAKIDVSDVSLRYIRTRSKAYFSALDTVRFSVDDGEFVAVVGPSGCGKTSLLHVIAGLLPSSSGSVHVNGKRVTKPGRDRAMVFQSPSLLPWRTVTRNVAYGLELGGMPRPQAEMHAKRFINIVGLTDFEDSYPNELSGGMRQRVNLARALAVEPELLLLDEPFASLDAQSRESMQVEVQRIWLQRRCSAILVTHQVSEAVFLADKVVVMGSHPGHVVDIVASNLPRPRTLAMKRQSSFHTIRNKIDDLLESLDRNRYGEAAQG